MHAMKKKKKAIRIIHCILFLGRVREAVSRMEDGQVVDVLDIALLEVRVHAEPVPEKVQGVEGLGLGLGDGRDIRVAGERAEADEGATGVLQRDPLRARSCRREVEYQRPRHVRRFGFIEPGGAPRQRH